MYKRFRTCRPESSNLQLFCIKLSNTKAFYDISTAEEFCLYRARELWTFVHSGLPNCWKSTYSGVHSEPNMFRRHHSNWIGTAVIIVLHIGEKKKIRLSGVICYAHINCAAVCKKSSDARTHWTYCTMSAALIINLVYSGCIPLTVHTNCLWSSHHWGWWTRLTLQATRIYFQLRNLIQEYRSMP